MREISDLLKRFLSNWVNSTSEKFTDHPTAALFKTEIKDFVASIATQFNNSLKIKASVGAGNWANVPWISILDPRLTETTQSGIYPVYLFCADGSGFYLSLNQGTTIPIQEFGKAQAQKKASELKTSLITKFPELSKWNNDSLNLVASTNLGKSYEPTNIASKFYPADAIPSQETLVADLMWLLQAYERCIYFLSETEPVKLQKVLNTTVADTKIYKPLLLLAGISGTGKTRFIREQAANQKGQDNYCLVPVRPDWHEPSDLLGYVSRLSGKKEYVTTPVIDFIVKSWIHIFEQTGEVRGDGKIGLTQAHLEQIPPFWLCLDEMNLAPVEQYFADYLSIIETRHWLTATDVAAYNEAMDSEYDHIYECAPLLKANVLNQQLDDAARQLLATQWQLDLNNSLHAKIWEHFCRYGIALPFNLMVAGTINMDETTHGFSRKVIDRALTFDFNEFFPNNFDHYFAPQLQPNILGYPLWSDGRAIVDDPALNEDKQSSVDFLKAVNTVLEKSPFELAYRALNELMLALLAHRPADKAHLIAIWDDFMMCKVLPRIEGDSDKLRSHRADTGANAPDNLLSELEEVLQKHFGACWDGLRPDLFNSRLGDSVAEATPAPAPHLVPCRSKKKLAWMKERLEKQCFTSYWP
ncbi:MrcB family domain-containing protein [Aeromonas schubertii]|uniref:MrcB family domain-containing protein n=1 Tax=Aeromonas schubertii TaxID=652 RepID=UPI0010A7F0EA|nr:DUF3578 domain-containing protein [Aeromonas schubertii]QCG48818.1 DUF3578 domain-containing protein [Aeromonas schubertii]